MRKAFIYSLAILALTCATHTVGQEISFMPLDEGLVKPASRTAVGPDGEILVAGTEKLIGFQNSRITARQWNGQFWVAFPGLASEQFPVSEDNKTAICRHNGRIYIAGSFRSQDTARLGIASWNGSAWEKTAGGICSDYIIHKEISIHDMSSFAGRLYVCGRFNIAGNKPVHNFTYLENNQWFSLNTGQGMVNDLQQLNDTLFIAGKFSQAEGVPVQNIAAYHSGTWISIGSPTSSEIKQLTSFGNSLLAFTLDSVFIRIGNTWKHCMQNWDYNVVGFGNAASYENKLYVAGTFGNSKGETAHLLQWDGSAWKMVVKEEHVSPKGQLGYFIDASTSGLYFSGNINKFRGMKVQNMIQFFPGKTIVKGRVFRDNNSNCIFDSGDKVFPNALVSINEGQSYTSCDTNGLYAVSLEKDMKSSLRIFPDAGFVSNCQPEYFEIITGKTDTSIERNFAIEKGPLPPGGSLGIGSSRGFKARHGYTCDYKLSYMSGDSLYPVKLRLKFDKRLQYQSSTLEPLSIRQGEIEWELHADTELRLVFQLPLTIDVGDELLFDLNAQQDKAPENILTESLTQEVVSAFDPNEKQCSEDKIGLDWKRLDYQVQFQNLGNDSAQNIYVVDTISRSLPMQFIKMLDYSHKKNYAINFRVRDHAIIWSFSDILLPPKSTAGNVASSGFIKFRAGLESKLNAGDSIANRAHIYFDYQAPVHTNKVLTVVENRSNPGPGIAGGEMYLYPNPAGDRFIVDLNPHLIQNIKVYDACGRLISEKHLNPFESNATIDLENPSPGIYIVRVEHTFGVVSKKLVVD